MRVIVFGLQMMGKSSNSKVHLTFLIQMSKKPMSKIDKKITIRQQISKVTNSSTNKDTGYTVMLHVSLSIYI